MAGVLRNVLCRSGNQAAKCSFLQTPSAALIPIATLKSVNSPFAPPPRPPPFKRLRLGSNLYDYNRERCFTRFDDNSRIITVEGNIATGKHELGKKLAAEFGMQFVPDIDFNKLYKQRTGVDLCDYNEDLGEIIFHNLETMMASKDLKKERFFIESQIRMFRSRLVSYMNALKHLFWTGMHKVKSFRL